MADSVKQYGVLVPAIVRQKEDGRYEMVAGHRRKAACELAGKTKIPCVVRDLTLEEAVVVMVDSNLQREQILPSEKAFAYKMKLDAIRRQQGTRTDLTSVPLGQKLGKSSREMLAENSLDSNTQIQRYIRLTALVPEILDLVDNTVLKEKDKLQIALRPAVELSYLAQQEQQALYESMITEDCTPSHAQAMKIRKYAEEGRLNPDVILSILQEEKPNQKEQFKIPKERISKYFAPGTPAQKIEDGEYSGYHGGNDNQTYTSAGLSFSHGSLGAPYAQVELKWPAITKRVSDMISMGRFLYPSDAERMVDYEVKQLAKLVMNFFQDTPDGFTKPTERSIFDYWDKQLETVDMEILHYLMRNPIWNASIEYNDNRLSLYSAQMGKCAITGAKLMIGDIFCHHKVPRCNGGTDAYQNLILLCGNAHRLIHATDSDTITRLTDSLNLTPKQKTKVDKLRSLVHVESC